MIVLPVLTPEAIPTTFVVPENARIQIFRLDNTSFDFNLGDTALGFGITPFGTYFFGAADYTTTVASIEKPQTLMRR